MSEKVVRIGEHLTCQHYRIDNIGWRCVECNEQMITQRTEAKTVLSAPNAAGCKNPACIAALQQGVFDERNPPEGCTNPSNTFIPGYPAREVVVGYKYSYECARCRNDGTLITEQGIEEDCGHSHQGAIRVND
jgi:hypothetical protein